MPRKKKAASSPVADADTRRAWLAKKRKKYKDGKSAVAGLQAQFGAALSYAEISNILAGRPARAGFASSGRRHKTQGGAVAAGKKRQGRTGKASGGAGQGGWVVATPGRGRGTTLTACASREEAITLANAALERGVNPARLAVYQQVEARVETRPKISF